jgi:hypothetical protein
LKKPTDINQKIEPNKENKGIRKVNVLFLGYVRAKKFEGTEISQNIIQFIRKAAAAASSSSSSSSSGSTDLT